MPKPRPKTMQMKKPDPEAERLAAREAFFAKHRHHPETDYRGAYEPGGAMWEYLKAWGYPDAFIEQHAENVRKANDLAMEHRVRDAELIAEARRAGRAYIVREEVQKKRKQPTPPTATWSLADE